jgi:hypothetical protein
VATGDGRKGAESVETRLLRFIHITNGKRVTRQAGSGTDVKPGGLCPAAGRRGTRGLIYDVVELSAGCGSAGVGSESGGSASP